ncbi:Protein of unknown function DUF1127 [Paracoccaceae bacterium]
MQTADAMKPPPRAKGIEAIMAYVNSSVRPVGWALRDLVQHQMHKLQKLTQRHRVYLQTVTELNALTDRELADLGLHRLMIPAVAKDAAYGK